MSLGWLGSVGTLKPHWNCCIIPKKVLICVLQFKQYMLKNSMRQQQGCILKRERDSNKSPFSTCLTDTFILNWSPHLSYLTKAKNANFSSAMGRIISLGYHVLLLVGVQFCIFRHHIRVLNSTRHCTPEEHCFCKPVRHCLDKQLATYHYIKSALRGTIRVSVL